MARYVKSEFSIWFYVLHDYVSMTLCQTVTDYDHIRGISRDTDFCKEGMRIEKVRFQGGDTVYTSALKKEVSVSFKTSGNHSKDFMGITILFRTWIPPLYFSH